MASEAVERSRARILEVAREMFPARGFAKASVRAIAAEADIDPSLVIRYFGSKEQLFVEAMDLDPSGATVLDGPIEGLGERIVEAVLGDRERIHDVFLALVRASDAGRVGSRLREAHEEAFVVPLQQRLEGPDAELRARMAAALVGGLLYAVWIVGDEALAGADPIVLRERYGAAIQGLLTP